MTREKRSTDSIEKEPDFVGFGGKSLVKTSIVNINELWRGKKIQSQIRLKKKHWFWTIVITKKPMNAFIPCLIWNYSIKIIKLQKWYVTSESKRPGKIAVVYHYTLSRSEVWKGMKVLQPNSIIVGTRKSWRIFPIKQKFDTTAAFFYSKNV